MTDEQNRILRVVDKKYSTFCTKEAIERNPLYLSDLTEPQQFWGDVVVRLCSGFASKKHQLGFLDCILKTGLPFNEAAIKQIISFLLDLFQNICESQSSYDAHYDSMLNCCAQLMVYCLTQSCTSSIDVYSLFNRNIMDHIKDLIIYSNSVECLIGCAVLFIHLIKLERQQNYLTEILNTINESVDSSVCLTSDSENLQFLSKLFCSDKHRSQLAVLLAITGIMSSDDWLESYINYGSQSVYILYVVGFTVETSSQQQYDRKDSVINLLLSKLVYNWSKKNLSSSVVSDSGKNTAHHSHIPMDSLVIFCLEMRSNPIDAIRYSALDTFENIIVYHLNVCNECRRPRSASETTTTTTTATTTGDCKPKISCDYLNEIFSRIVCDTCYSRGTIAVLTSLVRCIFKKSHYKIIDLLHTLSSVFGTSGRDVCEQVVSGLMKMANDPNLASSISELYTLIAQKIFTEKELSKKPLKSSFPDTLLHQSDPSYQCTFNQISEAQRSAVGQEVNTDYDSLMNSWLTCLVNTLIHQSNPTFHSTVNQNILPDLMKANHKLLELLVQSCNIELVHEDVHLSMFLLTCYRLLSSNRVKTDVRKYFSLDFLKSCLGAYDDQLRLTALNVLVGLITKTKELEGVNEKLLLFLDYLSHDLWPSSKHFQCQIVCAIQDILMHLLTSMKRGVIKTGSDSQAIDVEMFSTRLANILLGSIYPGSPPSRLSLALAGLHTFVNCYYSVYHTDTDSEFMIQILKCLNMAMINLFPIIIISSSSSNNGSDVCGENEFSPTIVHLYSLLLIGLFSRYDVDRDYAMKILFRLKLSKYINPEHIMHLWNNTLTLYTQSSRPDISPVGSDVLRYLVYESFSFPVISTCGYFIDIEKKNKDTSLYQLNSSQSTDDKAISAIFYLLDVLEEQIEACERRPNLSIMAVVSSRPFYAMLNAIRSVLGVMPSSSESQKSKDEVKSTLCDEEYLMMKTCLQRSTLFRKVNGKCILQRIIFLGIRISEIVLPIVGHESPEGILLQPDCMNDNNNVNEEEYSNSLDDDDESNVYKKTLKNPEYLILCCWRSVRELSLLMGVSLVSYCDFSETETELSGDDYRMKPSEIFQICHFFCTQLLRCRHRGAFEMCANGFTNFCSALVKHPKYRGIPLNWLNTITGQKLLNNEDSSKNSSIVGGIDFSLNACMGEHDIVKCVTRRGAGCPLFIQAILSAELAHDSNGLTVFADTLHCFLTAVRSPLSEPVGLCQSEDELATCVLNLNIIRGIFQSANFNCHTIKYVEKALIIALDGLGCKHLSIRNASMLFFSTLIQRIFGVTRSKAIKSRKNCLSTSTFFKHYPKFQQYLIDALTWYLNNTRVLPHVCRFKLYSLLYLMTHLLPPSQVTDVDKVLYKLLIRCSYYPDIRIRKVASSALTSIIHPSCIMEILDHLLCLIDEWRLKDSLSPTTRKTDPSNILHSLLLQLYALLYSTMEIHNSPVYLSPSAYISNTEYTSIIDRLIKSFSWLNNANIVKCPLIRLLYLKTLSPYYYNHQLTPVKSISSLNSLEYEYTEGNVNALIDYAICQGKNNIQVHKEVEQLLKSLNDISLLTSALRRISLYLCSKVGDPNDCSMNLENINAMVQCGTQPNTEVLKITENLFTIQTLLGIYYHQSVCNDNTSSNNNNYILTELKSMYKAEFTRYFYALLTILIHSTNTTTTTASSVDYIHKLLDPDYQRLLSIADPNSLITRGNPEVSFTAIQLYSYVNLIHITDDKQRKNDNGVIQNSSLTDHRCDDPFSLLCRLCNSRFSHSVREKLNPTGEEEDEELNYAALYSLCLLDMQRLVAFTSQNSGNTDERETLIAEVFITLIKNLVKPVSMKLEKLACGITQNLLVSSNTQSKCVLQSPFVLLPRLIDFLLKFNSKVFYKRLLRFTEEQLVTKMISKRGECTRMPIVQQTTFEEEYDTVELIKILFRSFSKSSKSVENNNNNNNNNNISVDIKRHDSLLHMMNSSIDEVFCCNEIELNELYDLSMCKPDTLTTLYLNRYIMNCRTRCF